MEQMTITSKGQMTLPAEIRRHFGLGSGDKVNCMIENDHILIVPVKNSIRSLKGFLPKPAQALSIEDMDAAIAEGATQQ